MSKSTLVAWIGHSDRKAAKLNTNASNKDEPGPILRVLKKLIQEIDEVCLLSDDPKKDDSKKKEFADDPEYEKWINNYLRSQKSSAKCRVATCTIAGKIDYKGIYEHARKLVESIRTQKGANARVIVCVNSGLPSMHAVWILLGKSMDPELKLFDSSYENGVVPITLHCSLHVEFIHREEVRRGIKNAITALGKRYVEESKNFDAIIHSCEKLKHQLHKAAVFAKVDINLIILGETGTGKELFAKAIHDSSSRNTGPFVPVNCGAISRNLVESELFGHVKGAFTDAIYDKKGKFEEAHKGTIFLDEIGDLPLESQVKILRVIQEGVVQRVGDKISAAKKVDVRCIAATNKSLVEEIRIKKFRDDLYYRLAEAVLYLPPLKERGHKDLEMLAEHFLSELNKNFEKYLPEFSHKRLSLKAKNVLFNYSWPGNVREMRNVLQRAILYSDGDEITADALNEAIRESSVGSAFDAIERGIPEPYIGFKMKDFIEQIREQLYLKAISKSNGTMAEVARLLDIKTQAVSNYLKDHPELKNNK